MVDASIDNSCVSFCARGVPGCGYYFIKIAGMLISCCQNSEEKKIGRSEIVLFE